MYGITLPLTLIISNNARNKQTLGSLIRLEKGESQRNGVERSCSESYKILDDTIG